MLGGRSKTPTADVMKKLEHWRDDGIEIKVMPVDLTSIDSVKSVADQIHRQCPPLGGVFHTAMVLEDKLLIDLDRATLERVLRPKVQGGWNLHVVTSDLDLDYFVLFSSLSSVFGHAGQANYSAANAFLDSLAHYRRALGMPAIAINWGHVGEVGYLAERNELSERLERQGVLTFSADEAMKCLDRMIATDTIQKSVLRMDWTRWRGLGITGDVSMRFAHLLRGRSEAGTKQVRVASPEEFRQAGPEEQRQLIANVVGTKAASLLGIQADEMDWQRPLLSMGLDSLMAVEMRNWIESRLEIDLPISELMRSESLDHTCRIVFQIVNSGAGKSNDPAEVSSTPAVETAIGSTLEPALDQVTAMSDDEVDAMLERMLNDSERENQCE